MLNVFLTKLIQNSHNQQVDKQTCSVVENMSGSIPTMKSVLLKKVSYLFHKFIVYINGLQSKATVGDKKLNP